MLLVSVEMLKDCETLKDDCGALVNVGILTLSAD